MINSIAIIVLASAVVVNTLMIRRLQQDAQEPPRREPRIEYTVTGNADALREMRKMSTWRGPSGRR